MMDPLLPLSRHPNNPLDVGTDPVRKELDRRLLRVTLKRPHTDPRAQAKPEKAPPPPQPVPAQSTERRQVVPANAPVPALRKMCVAGESGILTDAPCDAGLSARSAMNKHCVGVVDGRLQKAPYCHSAAENVGRCTAVQCSGTQDCPETRTCVQGVCARPPRSSTARPLPQISMIDYAVVSLTIGYLAFLFLLVHRSV